MAHQSTSSSKLTNIIYIAIMLCVTAVIYSNTLHSPFIFDDHPYIMEDNAIHLTHLTWSGIVKAALEGKPSRRLLPHISFALNYYFGRFNTFGYHLVNIAIHMLAGIFLFFFIKITLTLYSDPEIHKPHATEALPLRAPPSLIAFFATLIWMVYPVQTESVTYIVQRMTSMAAMFYILSLLLYAKGRMATVAKDRNRPAILLYFGGCVLFGICALISKENTATLPFFILIYEWFFFQDLKPIPRRRIIWVVVTVAVFAAICIAYMGENPIHRLLSGYARRDFTMHQRVLTELRVVVYYISMLVWPAPSRLNLDMEYPLSSSLIHPLTTLLCLIAILMLLYLAVYSAKKDRLLSFGIIWFFGNLVIVSTIVPIEIIFNHRTYLPFMVAILIPVVLIFRYVRQRKVAVIILCAISILFSVWTYQRNKVWHSTVSFWTDGVHKSPDKARPYKNLANALQNAGEYVKAIPMYKKAIDIGPPEFAICSNLATDYMRQKEYYDAAYYYGMSIKLNDRIVVIHRAYATALMMTGHFEAAKEEYMQALSLDPSNETARKALSSLTAFLNRFPTPEQRISEMIRQNPENPGLRLKQGELFFKDQNIRQAIDTYKLGLSLVRPDAEMIHMALLAGLAEAEAAQGSYDRSIRYFNELIRLKPKKAIFYYNVATLYAVQNKTGDAIRYLKQAAECGLSVDARIRNQKIFNTVRNSPLYEEVLNAENSAQEKSPK